MNNREMYETWKERQRGTQPSTGFSGRVMAAVRQAESDRHRRTRLLLGYFERITASSWAKAGLVTCGALIGLARLALALEMVL
jgi:hypothetical protein